MNTLLARSLKLKKANGFTLVEVLVGVLLILTFVGISTQAFVLSTFFRVRGQELSEATTWVQEDLENVRFEAGQLNFDTAVQDVALHSTRCAAGDATDGYADLLRDQILGSDSSDAISPFDFTQASAIGDRPYIVRRTITPSATPPYNTVEVRHAVYAADELPANPTEVGGADAIATSYAEIIPNASFSCR